MAEQNALQPANGSILPTDALPDGYRTWNKYWTQVHSQPWRTEQVIPEKQQRYLSKRLAIKPSIKLGIYPFKDIPLGRADIEWLLASHASAGFTGPIDVHDERQQSRVGLDLRGAQLDGANLSVLPLARMRGGLSEPEWINASHEQRQWAAVHGENVNLRQAHLEQCTLREATLTGAHLLRAHLEQADLYGAHLDNAVLAGAQMIGANLQASSLQDANLYSAFLEGSNLNKAHLERAILNNAHLEAATLWQTHMEDCSLAHVHLEGAKLYRTYLSHAFLVGALLGGKATPPEVLARVSPWIESFPAVLPAVDLRHTFFNTGTTLDDVELGNAAEGFVSVADVHWDGVNLGVLNWEPVNVLGDERYARRAKKPNGMKKTSRERLKEFRSAIRANRQLSMELRSQGINEDADRFAYRAQLCQRIVFRRQRKYLRYVGSLVLGLISGYGYKPIRSLLTYALVVGAFAITYYALGSHIHPPLDPLGAVVFSITSFHGRGFTPGENVSITNPVTVLAAIEAIIGLLIEIIFIATFTQRFFAR